MGNPIVKTDEESSHTTLKNCDQPSTQTYAPDFLCEEHDILISIGFTIPNQILSWL